MAIEIQQHRPELSPKEMGELIKGYRKDMIMERTKGDTPAISERTDFQILMADPGLIAKSGAGN